MTELDGSVSINETKFKEFFEANPDAFSAIGNTKQYLTQTLFRQKSAEHYGKQGFMNLIKPAPLRQNYINWMKIMPVLMLEMIWCLKVENLKSPLAMRGVLL